MADSTGYYSYLHISDIPTQVLSPQHTWPALLTLFFLAPIIPEMLTGSSPPFMFIHPVSLLFETGLYGSGAIIGLACSSCCNARKTYAKFCLLSS